MIYACKINHDDDALLEVLEYCDNRHKNEDAYFWSNIMSTLMQIYDIENLNEKHWNVIDEIILRNHVKNYLESYYDSTNRSLIEKTLYYRLKNNLPIDKMIEIYVDLERQHWNERWSILRDNPDYELRVFEASLDAVKARFESNNNKWTESKIYIVEDLLAEIYDYNKRHVKLNAQREKLSLKKFPWLMEMVQSIVTDQSKKNMVNDLKYSLKTNEKDLYDAWVMEKEKVADVSSGKAFTRLKKDPKCVLEQWEEYLSNCENGYYNGNTKRFLLACRWYKDIPIKFANEAVKRFQTEDKLSYLQILGTLLYGDTFTKLIEPYIPREKTIDVKSENAMNDYHLLISALEGMLVSNPPISLELVGRLCEGDYLSLALRVITNVCNRTAIPKIRSFANDLTSKRVSVRKHGIRLICAIQTLQESSDFLLSQWKNEDHHSIREVIFQKVCQLFQKQPGPVTWSAYKECISTLKLKDWATVKDQLIPSSSVPTEYIFDLIRLIMRTTDNFVKEGLEQEKAMYYLRNVFVKIDESIANVLPDEFCEEIIEKYLFDPDYVLDNFLREFLVQMYLFLRKDKIDSRVAALSRFFMAAVKSGWNVPHPKKAHFYPVNYTIYTIINDIVSTFLNRKDKDLRIIDGVLNFFTVFLTPENDITSYFLLILAKEYVESSTTEEFALRLGDKIPELIQKHTPLYPSCIIDSLQYFFAMICVDNLEEVKLTVIETLLECSSVYAHLVAVSSLPTINTPSNVARYDALVERFRNDNNPAIRSILYMKINGAGFYSCTVNP
ncbi:hypothetical protein KPH14_006703 [Odynerus spinipes]|nr:hypothetical protein KPH14_006703 [Odynerus spinipes]